MALNIDNFKKYQKEYYLKNKDRKKMIMRKNHLKRNFGISIEQYNELLKNQNYSCVICGTKETQDRRSGYLSVDHCHKSGKIRGLLCGTCNRGLGYFKDNPELLYNAFSYLKNYK